MVKKGDTLPSIAARHEIYNDSFMWPLIYKANRDQIKDPKVLYAGQDLKIPREMTIEEIVEARREAGAPEPEKIPKDAYIAEREEEITWPDGILRKRVFYYTPGQELCRPASRRSSKGNYYRSIFNYDEVPKIDFDMRLIPIQPAEDIFITDTTFRDGQQSMPPFSVEQIERIFDFLHRISGRLRPHQGAASSSSTPRRTRQPWRPAWPRGITFPR
ncbi:MAG: LysM peptidoglycan-binding domain-containing protein [Desulfobacterales bacterium]|nr:LysM peptidoglycan-binding domain-containing protein [Desulfobacterales bacterium]